MALETPDSLLAFWIGDAATSPEAAKAKNKLWFRKSFLTDTLIAERFLPTLAALAGGLAYEWAVASPRARLAAIIALDQFPRNIFRGTAGAFELDGKALDLAMHGIMLAQDLELAPVERQFFYMPLEHSERAADQDLCVDAFQSALADAPEGFKPHIQDALGYAVKHKDVIDKFGRFPHRNKVLGRTSSEAEIDWLKEHGGF